MPTMRDKTSSATDTTRQDIDRRLQSLRQEVARLEAARAALVGGRRKVRQAGRPAAVVERTRRRSLVRGPRKRGTRSSQALELVQRQPGITIPQIAESLKIRPDYLYRIMPKLMNDQQVRREGHGWVPNADATSVISAPHPRASIPYSDEEYDALTDRLERPASPNERLKRTLSRPLAPRG